MNHGQTGQYPLIERTLMPAWISAVPWMQLIAAAPAIARGARKLWTGIREPQPDAPLGRGERLERLEAEMGDLRKELAASAEVIKAMAEQNERLVEAVGILRARVRLLTVGCVILLILAVTVAAKLWAT
jgi:hypothetical protein